MATTGIGVKELADAIEKHHDYLIKSGEIEKRRLRSEKKHAEHVMMNEIREIINRSEGKRFEEILREIRKSLCG